MLIPLRVCSHSVVYVRLRLKAILVQQIHERSICIILPNYVRNIVDKNILKQILHSNVTIFLIVSSIFVFFYQLNRVRIVAYITLYCLLHSGS